MQTHAFTMTLKPGFKDEYKRRHDEIWPELVTLLHEAGIKDYHIFLDEESLTLFGVLKRDDNHTMDQLPETALMKKWWAYMADIMLTHPTNEPVAKPLLPVFFMA